MHENESDDDRIERVKRIIEELREMGAEVREMSDDNLRNQKPVPVKIYRGGVLVLEIPALEMPGFLALAKTITNTDAHPMNKRCRCGGRVYQVEALPVSKRDVGDDPENWDIVGFVTGETFDALIRGCDQHGCAYTLHTLPQAQDGPNGLIGFPFKFATDSNLN